MAYDRYGNMWVNAWKTLAPDSFTPVADTNYNSRNQLLVQNSRYDQAGNQDRIGNRFTSPDAPWWIRIRQIRRAGICSV